MGIREEEVDRVIQQHIQDYSYFEYEIKELTEILKLKEQKAIDIVSKRYNQFLVN